MCAAEFCGTDVTVGTMGDVQVSAQKSSPRGFVIARGLFDRSPTNREFVKLFYHPEKLDSPWAAAGRKIQKKLDHELLVRKTGPLMTPAAVFRFVIHRFFK